LEHTKHKGSGYSVKKIRHVFLKSYNVKPLRGSSYIPTPEKFTNPKCGLVNIKNEDNECFKWCMKYHQSPKAKHDDRTTVLRRIDDKYTYEDVNFPASFDDIETFEQNNKVAVFVYAIKDDSVFREKLGNPEYVPNDVIYLLRIENEETSHYVYIKHLSRLINFNFNGKTTAKQLCPYCEKACDECLTTHIKTCYKIQFKEGALLKLPEPDTYMKFENHKNKLMRPFMFYADTESTLKKTDDDKKIHEHIINSCCFYFVCTFDSSRNELFTFEGSNCLKDMTQKMFELSELCISEMKVNARMVMTDEDEKNFKKAKCCYLCNEEFDQSSLKFMKVRDHDHRTGCYRGPAHSKCNINYFLNRYVPVVFHNLRGYDSHLIIKEIYSLFPDKDLSVIPNSYEKFMSFKLGPLRFIDSFQFMASSLEKLVTNLYDKDDKFKNFSSMKQYFNDQMNLLCQKGHYPYEWMDDVSKMDHVGLPPKDSFYSKLSQTTLSDNDYKHAQHVYETLNCQTFRDYHLTYLKTDVLLLADVFEHFRKTCYSYYSLDPANYISAPGLAWDAMLLKTGVHLELIHDLHVLDIMERQKKGGLTFLGSKRHVVANNKYTRHFKTTGKWLNSYNEAHPEKPIIVDDVRPDDNYIIYLDANNLYGWAMSQPLPYDEVKINTEITIDEVLKTSDDSKNGYVVECDLHFPKHIHEKLKQYPPAPENMIPKDEWLSEYQKEIKQKLNIKNSTTKLIPHLMDHNNYCIHYRNLKYIVGLGVEIKKVHNIVSFKQKAWLKPYIDFNTEMRKEAKNDFEKDFFKLMNNSVFGKTMENIKNRVNIHATTSEQNAVKWFSKIHMKGAKYFSGLYLIEMYKEEVLYDKPLYVGASILDLSKLCMMEFHYDVIEKEFSNRYELIYSDTDSMVYNFKHPDIYDWIKNNKNHFDLSESERPDLKNNTNKKVLGKFKDENNSLLITEFLALNPKVYSFKYQHELESTETKNKKTLKGVSKTVVKKEIDHKDYVNVLETDKKIDKTVTSIRSFNHQLFTYVQNKTALTSYYDKMMMLDNNTCVPFGYLN
jgi:hypothetical protein